jgi:thioredoxin 1
MGGHNRSRPCPNLGWMGVDGEQIVWQNGSCDAQSGAGSLCRIPVGELRGPAYVGWALVMSYAGPGGLTPRRGLVYDAVSFANIFLYSAKEECDVAGDALKVEDATWDADVMKASELVMVDFWAVWCGPCQMVAPIVEELAKEYAGKVKVRKLNTDENPEVAGRYQVMSIPTILFFKNGQVVEKLVGARPKRQFKEMIDSLLAQPAGSA